jgi:hypothetical protein
MTGSVAAGFSGGFAIPTHSLRQTAGEQLNRLEEIDPIVHTPRRRTPVLARVALLAGLAGPHRIPLDPWGRRTSVNFRAGLPTRMPENLCPIRTTSHDPGVKLIDRVLNGATTSC